MRLSLYKHKYKYEQGFALCKMIWNLCSHCSSGARTVSVKVFKHAFQGS